MSSSLALDAIALTELKARLPDDVRAIAWKIASYVLFEAVSDCGRPQRGALRYPEFSSNFKRGWPAWLALNGNVTI
jgi:hypothetical protein